MPKTAAAQVIKQPNLLPHLMGATPDSVLEHLLKDLNRVADPVTGKVRPKAETGQSVAQSRTERDDYLSQIDKVYGPEVQASTQNQSRKATTTYGPDNIVVATDAATVGQDQGWVRAMLANPNFNNDELFKDPALTKEQELVHLQNFARLWGVSPKEVAVDPSLYQAFGRYMGKIEGKASADKYFGYNLSGERDTNQDKIVGKPAGITDKEYEQRLKDGVQAITPWVTPQHVFENSGAGTTVQDMALSLGFRLSEKQFLEREAARGVSDEEAKIAWEDYKTKDTTESIIDANLGVINKRAFTKIDTSEVSADGKTSFIKTDTRNVATRMGDKFYKVFNNYLRNLSMGPKELSRFTQKFKEENPEISLESAKELMFTLVGTHAAMQEKAPQVGRAWSDIIMLAVLHHSLRNVWKFQQEKDSDVDPDIDPEEEFNQTLMTGAADDRHIGRAILENMGFERATRSQHTLMGAMARAMVSDTFKDDWGNKDKTALWDRKLFEEVKTDQEIWNPETGKQERTLKGFTLTQDGLNLAQDLEPLFSVVLPLSQRDVRYTKKVETAAAIRKLKNKISKETGEEVSIGEVERLTEALNHLQNTPVRVYQPFVTFLQNIVALLQDPEGSSQVNEILNGPKYLNIKGHGKGYKGTFNSRPGFVFSVDRKGRLLNKEGKVVTSFDEAEQLTDHSDKVKDAQLLQTLDWALRNINADGTTKEFFYDYFLGLNTRFSVDQTLGNYQHNKIARAAIEAGVPNEYNLTNIKDVIAMKAGIMKRFGFDNSNPIEAANLFDQHIDKWMGMTDLEVFTEGKGHEGWASVASILEAKRFQEALNQPGKTLYKSGFFTEIDGKTNGMAWSASQSGNSFTATGAFIFEDQDYLDWEKHYDAILRFQEADNLEGLKKYAGNNDLNPNDVKKFFDAYRKVNETLKTKVGKVRRTVEERGGTPVDRAVPLSPWQNFPGFITDTASYAFKDVLKIAKRENFIAALDIMEAHEEGLGRSFIKKPVMIFGYGAGEAMILLTVKNYIDGKMQTVRGLQEAFTGAGINVDTDFIDPLGVAVAESIGVNFKTIKDFGKTLSLAATEAESQGFSLVIPTLFGYKINLGKVVNELTGQRRRGSFVSGSPERKKGTFDSRMMESEFDPFYGIYVADRKILKAATSISVMLNHANDNINMIVALLRKHKAKLRKEQVYDGNEKETGGTALHIFDAVLVTPKEAEGYADTLNDVFKEMNTAEKDGDPFGHAEAVAYALTYELDNSGNRILDPHINKRLDINGNLITSKPGKGVQYKRKLLPEGMKIANTEGNEISTWSRTLDKYAFNWNLPDETTHYYTGNKKRQRKIKHSQSLKQELAAIRNKRKDLMDKVTRVKQFFYSTRPLEEQIKSSTADLSHHKKDFRRKTFGQNNEEPGMI